MSAILKTYIHSNKSCASFQKHLDFDSNNQYRAIGYDYSFGIADEKNWGHEFDEERKAYGKNKGRHFYHFVISPDPKENATLDQLQILSWEWVTQHFLESEWIITYHNDTDILHAHIVVNAVQVGGTKIHLDFKDWIKLQFDLQETAKVVGFTLPAPKSYYDQYRDYAEEKSV